jgi:hypothetical protein
LGRAVPIIAHRDIASTQCPGEGITAQIAAGLFERSTNIMRISGANRYDTSALISRQVYPQGAKVVYIASGTKFPDALSASMFKDGPLLLTDPDRLSPETAAEITRLNVDRVVIIGGPLGVSTQVEKQIDELLNGLKADHGIDLATSVQEKPPAAAVVSPAPLPYPGVSLRRGSKGNSVRAVQARVGSFVDGDYGPKTEAAVKKWQAANPSAGPADGVVGPMTWRAMFG